MGVNTRSAKHWMCLRIHVIRYQLVMKFDSPTEFFYVMLILTARQGPKRRPVQNWKSRSLIWLLRLSSNTLVVMRTVGQPNFDGHTTATVAIFVLLKFAVWNNMSIWC